MTPSWIYIRIYSFYLAKWQNLVMGFLRIEFLLWFMIRAFFFWSNVRIFNSFLPRSCVLHIIEFLHRLLNIFLSHIFRSHFTLRFNCFLPFDEILTMVVLLGYCRDLCTSLDCKYWSLSWPCSWWVLAWCNSLLQGNFSWMRFLFLFAFTMKFRFGVSILFCLL